LAEPVVLHLLEEQLPTVEKVMRRVESMERVILPQHQVLAEEVLRVQIKLAERVQREALHSFLKVQPSHDQHLAQILRLLERHSPLLLEL
jgi:hypothetical protein